MKFHAQQTWYKRLEILRISMDLTQEQLAEKVGVIQQTYQRWESGKHVPIKPYRQLLAAALKTTEKEIFGDHPKVKSDYQPKKAI